MQSEQVFTQVLDILSQTLQDEILVRWRPEPEDKDKATPGVNQNDVSTFVNWVATNRLYNMLSRKGVVDATAHVFDQDIVRDLVLDLCASLRTRAVMAGLSWGALINVAQASALNDLSIPGFLDQKLKPFYEQAESPEKERLKILQNAEWMVLIILIRVNIGHCMTSCVNQINALNELNNPRKGRT